jgi:hypothetical protein
MLAGGLFLRLGDHLECGFPGKIIGVYHLDGAKDEALARSAKCGTMPMHGVNSLWLVSSEMV